ncbi:DUF433 domain-containing protein [Pseudanabaena yagii]|uniref:DUF433 domain-containing protein n=1 Tax=Pseudanabaena yagii GIHE-NHR1 TaxID=2722753 RepID=A0ABX1LPR9_9CYAN|nr:DUF433 domain-containing protein [Pseudanabaena yagii]NMF56774.1 DUF433 domain-containing protein [Pseudanabaena yagii GIHE-NHR1]
MTATIIDIGTFIVRSPDICGDRPRIAGTRITVGRIATLWKQGLTPEEIAENWGYLSMAQVYAALTYYHANREEIEQALRRDREDYDRLYAEHLATKVIA